MHNIVVDRDVRDIYAECVTHSTGFNENVKMFSKLSGAHDVELFIQRQKLLRQKIINVPDHLTNRNIVIYFDDLILDFEKTKAQLLNFMGIEFASSFGSGNFQIEHSKKI